MQGARLGSPVGFSPAVDYAAIRRDPVGLRWNDSKERVVPSSNNSMPAHMDRETFRKHGHALIDWIADYLHDPARQTPVLSQVRPGDVRAQLPSHPPRVGEPFELMMRDVESIIMPGLTHWQSPSFFGYFPANTSEPAILGELLSAGMGVQGMLWSTSPACTEVESHVLDWLVDMLALPDAFKSSTSGGASVGGGGVIQDTASSSTLCALLAGRERATRGQSNRTGATGTLTAYTSSQTHSSVEKAMRIAGLGSDNLRLIDVDAHHAMRADALADAIERDIAAGNTPCFVCATVGTTSTNAIDPVRAIGEVTSPHAIWLHVDAAMSGTAALCEEYRQLQDGLEHADSYCFNPHKWMLTNFDCDCFYVRDRAALINTLSILPEYLRNAASDSGEVFDYRDWHIPLGRRFRALKLWFVIRHYGIEGLQQHVRHHVELAQEFAQWVREDDDFELITDPPLNLVCFRHVAGDERSQRIMESVNASGEMFMTHTRLDDRFILRLAIGGTRTERQHVERAWALIREAGRKTL